MALYGSGFPATYQPMGFTPYTPQAYANAPQMAQNVQNQQGNGIIWVQGEAGAKSYLVAPNNTVQLWDSESQVIYLKSADASGMPSMKVLDYTIRDGIKNAPNSVSLPQEGDLSMYVTKEEMRGISEQITALRDRVDSLSKRRAREETE